MREWEDFVASVGSDPGTLLHDAWIDFDDVEHRDDGVEMVAIRRVGRMEVRIRVHFPLATLEGAFDRDRIGGLTVIDYVVCDERTVLEGAEGGWIVLGGAIEPHLTTVGATRRTSLRDRFRRSA